MAGVAVAQSSPMAALARSSVLFITSSLFVPVNAPGRRESETLGPQRKLDLGPPPLEGGGGASARPMIDRTARTALGRERPFPLFVTAPPDRKSTRLNSSH